MLIDLDIPHTYETEKLKYVQPAANRNYLVDFSLKEYPDVIIETKGRFTSADRKKMLLIKEQYPNKTIIMVFGRSHNTLSKSSKTSYGDWCDKQGILWTDIATVKEDPSCLFNMISKRKTGSSNQKLKKNTMRSSKSERLPSSKSSRRSSRPIHSRNG